MYTLKSDAGRTEKTTSLRAFSDTETRHLHIRPRRIEIKAFRNGAYARLNISFNGLIRTNANHLDLFDINI